MTTSDKPPYEVGYCRPPVDTQFKPGQSGNPNGRPKRRRSFEFDVIAALDAPSAGANGTTTKQQRLAQDLVDDALAHDPLARKIVTQIARDLDHDEGDQEDEAGLEQKLLDELDRREQSTDCTITLEDESHE